MVARFGVYTSENGLSNIWATYLTPDSPWVKETANGCLWRLSRAIPMAKVWQKTSRHSSTRMTDPKIPNFSVLPQSIAIKGFKRKCARSPAIRPCQCEEAKRVRRRAGENLDIRFNPPPSPPSAFSHAVSSVARSNETLAYWNRQEQ